MSRYIDQIDQKMAEVGAPAIQHSLGEVCMLSDMMQGVASGALWPWKFGSVANDTKDEMAILLPGLGTTTLWMEPVKRQLQKNGYRVMDWGQGRNTGQVQELLDGFVEMLQAEVAKSGKPALLVGWSLGGYIARETARDHPHLVRKIITMGSPVVGGPRHSAVRRFYDWQGVDTSALSDLISSRYEVPLETPVTAIYSKRDGIVHWQACIDHWSPNIRHVETKARHLGMGFAPEVLEVIREAA